MNKNKIIALAFGCVVLAAMTPHVFAYTTKGGTESVQSSVETVQNVEVSQTPEKTTSELINMPIITIELDGANRTNLLSDLGLTEEEFSELGLGNATGSDAFGGQQSAPMGEKTEFANGGVDGSAPQMPNGVVDGSAPQMPNGGVDGSAPQMPNGGAGGSTPQMPENSQISEAPQAVDGGNQQRPGGDGFGKGGGMASEQMPEQDGKAMDTNRAGQGTEMIVLFQDDIDTLVSATEIGEDDLLELLKVYEASK